MTWRRSFRATSGGRQTHHFISNLLALGCVVRDLVLPCRTPQLAPLPAAHCHCTTPVVALQAVGQAAALAAAKTGEEKRAAWRGRGVPRRMKEGSEGAARAGCGGGTGGGEVGGDGGGEPPALLGPVAAHGGAHGARPQGRQQLPQLPVPWPGARQQGLPGAARPLLPAAARRCATAISGGCSPCLAASTGMTSQRFGRRATGAVCAMDWWVCCSITRPHAGQPDLRWRRRGPEGPGARRPLRHRRLHPPPRLPAAP